MVLRRDDPAFVQHFDKRSPGPRQRPILAVLVVGAIGLTWILWGTPWGSSRRCTLPSPESTPGPPSPRCFSRARVQARSADRPTPLLSALIAAQPTVIAERYAMPSTRSTARLGMANTTRPPTCNQRRGQDPGTGGADAARRGNGVRERRQRR